MLTFFVVLVALISVQATHPAQSQLGLTSQDLNEFANDVLSLLQAQCPNLDPSEILRIQEFIGRKIAKVAGPVPGDKQTFREVLKTVTECTAEVNPGGNSKGLPSLKRKNPENVESSGALLESRSKDEPKEDKGKLILTIQSDSLFNLQPTTTPRLPIMTEATKEEKPGVISRFFSWVGDIFDSVASFFKRMSGSGTGTRPRPRRSASPDHDDSGKLGHVTTPCNGEAFGQLIKGVCKICRDNCEKVNATEFKMAGKELMNYFFTQVSPTGNELAGHVTPEFIGGIAKCIMLAD